ncbi:MAG: dimethylarginine dimethylaminohydrolase family protein [Actinomycetes bacterium]
MSVQPLSWGRRYLMCRPEHFRVDYAINPWMDIDVPLDTELALAQWDQLAATIESAGATVERIAQRPETPDMVYAMNYGFVDGDHIALTSFRYDERRPEADAAEWWFGELGFRTTRVADAGVGAFEAGDAFLFGNKLVVAAGPRTDLAAHPVLARTFGVDVASVGVVHPALYHLDLSFCPLDETKAIVAPAAWDAAGRETVRGLVPEPLVIDEDESFTFCANSVVIGNVVVMPAGVPTRVAGQLERWGFDVVTVDVSELHKGGGSIRCMTLPLDTRLDAARSAAAMPEQRFTEAVPALD